MFLLDAGVLLGAYFGVRMLENETTGKNKGLINNE